MSLQSKKPGQFILFIHTEHTTADHKDDSSRYLSVDEQDFVHKAVKTAPLKTAAELIKNVQDSPTKQIDSTLKRSVTRLICSERAKLSKAEFDGVELTTVTSNIGSLKRLADKKISSHLYNSTSPVLKAARRNASTALRHSASARPSSALSDAQCLPSPTSSTYSTLFNVLQGAIALCCMATRGQQPRHGGQLAVGPQRHQRGPS